MLFHFWLLSLCVVICLEIFNPDYKVVRVHRIMTLICLMSITLTAHAAIGINGKDVRVRVSADERADVKALVPSVISLIDNVDQMLSFMKPTQTSLELFGLLDLRDSYNKHANYEIVIGLYNISQLTTAVQAVITHEYAHASLYEYIKIKNPDLDINRIRPLLRPYNELYADLVAALFFDDPKIMFTSLENGEKKSEKGMSRTRDFSINHKFEDWTESIVGENIWDIYIQLDPARGKIWEYIKVTNLSREKYPLLLEAFVLTTVDHILKRMERGETEEHQQDPGVVNNEFFTSFVSNLKL